MAALALKRAHAAPDLEDIQGIWASAYSKLAAADYVLLNIPDAADSRGWLAEVLEHLRWADAGIPQDVPCSQIAFTYEGFERVGLSWQAMKGFSREFQEGMTGNERRSRALGDVGNASPENWDWGGPNTTAIHVLLLLYANDERALEALYSLHRSLYETAGLSEVLRLRTLRLTDDREHFGFRDGVSDVKVRGLSHSSDESRLVQPGEFLLGYPNEHGSFTTRPLVDPIEDPQGILSADRAGSDQRDFGRNGCYLVFRQLAQHVTQFNSFVRAAVQHGGQSAPSEEERLAAKWVGRWKNGAALVHFPDAAPTDVDLSNANNFQYHHEDPLGLKCPIGAHIRRTNPRDSLAPSPGTPSSLAVNKRHQLIRRGRTYGNPLDAHLAPDGVAGDSNEPRGLHFICLNANIARQFEFIQNTWANNENFAGLYADSDPLIGCHGAHNLFTVPAEPFRKRIKGLSQFVTVRGGGYFFLPGKKALHYLASGARHLAVEYNAPAAPASQLFPTVGLHIARSVSRRLEAFLAWTRRLTSLRNVFDRALRPAIARIVQFLIQRRRQDLGLGIAEEMRLPDEEETTRKIAEQMTAFLFKHYRSGVAERAGNTKTYGLVRAVFEIEDGLRESLRLGLFKQSRHYPAWVRFGGPGPLVVPDIKDHGILSIGVKLMGVEGEKFIDDERRTLDLTGISAPTFTTPNVIENLKLQQHLSRETSVFYFLNPFDSHYLDGIMQGLYAKAHGNPLETSYWSCVPYLFGDGRAIKFGFFPVSAMTTPVPRKPSDDYLRDAMVNTLTQSEIVFDFRIQFQTDAHRMPIEDASVEWPEKLSPFVTVAKLRIPRQRFASAKQLAFARNLTFNPWHTIPEHRPLGNQNRARLHIYLATSHARQQINKEAKVEPTGNESFD